MKKTLVICVMTAVLVVLSCGVQAQLPTLILPDEWDGEGWIFRPPNGCGLSWWNFNHPPQDPPPAGDPVIGPITGFRFDILSQERHVFWGVGLPAGFDAALDAAEFTVTAAEMGLIETIETGTWNDVLAGDRSNWVIFADPVPPLPTDDPFPGPGVKSFTITWDDPLLFFDPENPEDQRIFPVWWGVDPHDCLATVKMTPIPEPVSFVLMALGSVALLKKRRA